MAPACMKDWHWLLLVFPATNVASAVSFMLLCSLSYVKTQHQSSLLRHLMLLVTIISVNLQDKSQNSSNLKIPALTFLRTALESTDPSIWQKHLPVLSPAVFATVGERYYKVTAQGLRVAERLIFVIRPSTQSQIPGGSSVSLHSWLHAFCRLEVSHLILCHLHVRGCCCGFSVLESATADVLQILLVIQIAVLQAL